MQIVISDKDKANLLIKRINSIIDKLQIEVNKFKEELSNINLSNCYRNTILYERAFIEKQYLEMEMVRTGGDIRQLKSMLYLLNTFDDVIVFEDKDCKLLAWTEV